MIYLTVVVPIRNEERFIEQTLNQLIGQDYPKDRYEILIIDGYSDDRTLEIVNGFIKKHPDVSISTHMNPGRLSSSARNIGAKQARGKMIAVIDGHVYIPGERLFRDIETLAETHAARCLGMPSPLDVPEIRDGMPYWIALARKSKLGHSQESYIYKQFEGFVNPTSNAFVYAKSLFGDIGYFDESFDAAEDVEYNYRLHVNGIQAYTSHKFLIYHYPRETLKGLFKQMGRYGVGRARFIRKHPESFTKETVVPSLILLMFLLLPLNLFIYPWIPLLSIIWLAAVLLYLALLFLNGLAVVLRLRKFFPAFIIAAAIWMTHIGFGWGFLKTIKWPTRQKTAEKKIYSSLEKEVRGL